MSSQFHIHENLYLRMLVLFCFSPLGNQALQDAAEFITISWLKDPKISPEETVYQNFWQDLIIGSIWRVFDNRRSLENWETEGYPNFDFEPRCFQVHLITALILCFLH